MTSTQTQEGTMTTDTNTRIWSISYLAEMIGDCDDTEARVACEALVESGLLEWHSDREGGWLRDPDDRFMAVACSALS